MKYSNLVGIFAAAAMMVACFLPWAYYPDLDKAFTGFFSQHNIYGRPGFFFLFLGTAAILLFLIPRVWAKRSNLLVSALIMAFAVKTCVLFTACYRGTCPTMRVGLYLLLASTGLLLIAAVLPDMKLKK
jgi:hypothetical protein